MKFPSSHSKFQFGDRVEKTKGSNWHGKVVGCYATELTPEGYAVESSTESGSVQIYPASALRLSQDYVLVASPARCSQCKWSKPFVGARGKTGNLNCTNIMAVPSGKILSGDCLDKIQEVSPNFGCIYFSQNENSQTQANRLFN